MVILLQILLFLFVFFSSSTNKNQKEKQGRKGNKKNPTGRVSHFYCRERKRTNPEDMPKVGHIFVFPSFGFLLRHFHCLRRQKKKRRKCWRRRWGIEKYYGKYQKDKKYEERDDLLDNDGDKKWTTTAQWMATKKGGPEGRLVNRQLMSRETTRNTRKIKIKNQWNNNRIMGIIVVVSVCLLFRMKEESKR